MKHITTFWDWIDSRAVVRRIVLFVTLWLTYDAFQWAAKYAMTTSETNGVEAAAVIAAVTAPVSALGAAIFKLYVESRGA